MIVGTAFANELVAMARLARVVVPGIPHHVTQRGNRRLPTFFHVGDYEAYLGLLSEFSRKCDVEIWAYCLLPNHVHLIAVPAASGGLRHFFSEVHRRYTRHINSREKWQGHLWQGRFFSFPMDESHLLAAARYIERNPVAAGKVRRPEDYPWSSARAHLEGHDDMAVRVDPLLSHVDDWGAFLAEGTPKELEESLNRHARTGRPLGSTEFLQRLEILTGRMLTRQKPGRKPLERDK